ncbi:glycerate kinase [Flagellimonas pacifica]|uniref:Glycerate kinase n=1 Tax=Flagellimonas pacifica TaxID=1247520 RepID=A0A285MDU4_9FLAO|nr:glycerate kinase [Allomuricauda parva]SNY95340.1 glycerate kinase [Allomuricauda parva]
MKFVLAPDKYKGSLSGLQFCEVVEQGLRRTFPNAEIAQIPLADGGDGTMEVVQYYLKASRIKTIVKDPLYRDIESGYLFSKEKGIAFVEMSEASGYKLLTKDELNCMHTTTFGTGQLIVHAMEQGAKQVVLGIGGSATNDVGMGMAAALGYRFLDEKGNELLPIGKNLNSVAKIDSQKVLAGLENIEIKVACDVNNPLHGKHGAAYVYGPQKGASADDIVHLNQGLKSFAKIIHEQFGIDAQKISGAGAAGGMGAGTKVFLNATLLSGIDLIKEIANFDNTIEGADWIITGEGQLDNQTLSGKTIVGVIQSAKARNIPVAAFCGSIDVSIEEIESMGLQYVTSILNGVGNLEDAKKNTSKNLEMASYNFAKLLKQKQG